MRPACFDRVSKDLCFVKFLNEQTYQLSGREYADGQNFEVSVQGFAPSVFIGVTKTTQLGSREMQLSLCSGMGHLPHSYSPLGFLAVIQAPPPWDFPARITSGLPFPPPGDLPHPGTELVSPALAGGFFTTKSPGKPGWEFI